MPAAARPWERRSKEASRCFAVARTPIEPEAFPTIDRTDDSSVWRRRFLDVEEEWNRAIDQWERRSGFTKIESLKASLIEAKRAYEALASEQTERINRYQDERESLQRAKFLERFRIRDYKISGADRQTRNTYSYGIETAADVTWDSVLAIAGFGPTNSKPLLEWQQQCARRFVYDPKPTAADQLELNKIKTDIQKRRETLRQKLQLKAQQFGQAVQSCKTMFKQGDPELEALHARRKQIEADLTYIGIPLPPRPTRPTPQPATPRPVPITFRYSERSSNRSSPYRLGNAFMPPMRQSHGQAHGAPRPPRRQGLLGMFPLPKMHRNAAYLIIWPRGSCVPLRALVPMDGPIASRKEAFDARDRCAHVLSSSSKQFATRHRRQRPRSYPLSSAAAFVLGHSKGARSIPRSISIPSMGARSTCVLRRSSE